MKRTCAAEQRRQNMGVRRWRVAPPSTPRPGPDLSVVRPIAKTRLRPGVVVWAHVPFEDADGEKARPAVVRSVAGRDVTVLPGSSALSRYRFPGRYVELTDLDAAGLARPTGIRRRAVTVDIVEIIDVVGALGRLDAAAVLGSGTTHAGAGLRLAAEAGQ